MPILIACEFTGIVRNAFIAAGIPAVSCDLLPSELPGNHIQADIRTLLNQSWDAIIAFPPCTDLSAAGSRYWKVKDAAGKIQKAIDFVRYIYDSPVKYVAIENPTGILSTRWRKPDQIIHPYYFGQPYAKRTCLWLKNLPPLYHGPLYTNQLPGGQHWCYSGNKLRPCRGLYSDSKNRSRSFTSIAYAMASQWSPYFLKD